MPTNNRWVVLGLVLLTTTVGMMGFAANFPLLNLWIQDLGISRTQGGLLSGLWYLPGVVISLPAGWAFDRYSIRRVLLGCWVLIVVGVLLMAIAPSFWVLAAGRLVFSVGMNAHMIGAPKLLGAAFAGRRELGFVMGIYTMAFTAGVFLAMNVLGSIGAADGWRRALQLLTGLSAVGAAVLLLLPREADRASASSGPAPAFNPLALGAGAWLLATAYAGFSIGTDAILTFGPDALVGRGFGVAEAAAIVGSYAVVALVLKPLLASQLRPATGVLFVTLATGAAVAASAAFFAPQVPPRAAAAVLGVAFALGMPGLLAMPSFLFSTERSGRVYGLYQALYSLGFVAQPIVGMVVDRTGSYPAGFVVIGGYCLIGFLVLAPAVRRLRSG
ncbi:MAG: CynX/NimT family MFS transporter [Gemmatimonadales bacterium]